MSNYISAADWNGYLKSDQLNQIIEGDFSRLDDAELDAISIVGDHMNELYDMDAEFAKVNTARNRTVVRLVMTLALYFLYNRIPDGLVPERVKTDYSNALTMLKGIMHGKPSLQLDRREDTEGNKLTRFRGGSDTARQDGLTTGSSLV